MDKKMRKHIKNSELLRELGHQLREWRQRSKLTQEQLALRAGLNRVNYRAIETGAAAPRASTLINIARALGMEMMLIPKEMAPAVQAMLRSGGDDQPAFTADPDEDSE
jgi:DNA-binding XRE family transcriptional regulator